MLSLVATKLLSLTVLGAASLMLGLLPLRLARPRGRHTSGAGEECPRHAAAAGPLLTALLSFGAGALLATALVHMLAEASEELPKGAPVGLLVGFLVLYLVDELVQRVLGHSPAAARAHRARPHPACPVDEPCVTLTSKSAALGGHRHGSRDKDYGSLDLDESAGEVCEATSLLREPDSTPGGHGHGHGAGGASCWGLLLALSIHSIIEGLAVGLEETPQQVLFLLGAVSSHKLVVSFCLGAELVGGGVALGPHLVAVLVFSLGSAAGVGVGMALYGLGAMPGVQPGVQPGVDLAGWPLLPVLQAAAAGTLLYVTLAEVLPRERARSQNNFPRRLLQFSSFTVGVVLITVLVIFLDVHHDPVQEPLGPG